MLPLFVLVATVTGCQSGQSWKNPGPRETFDNFLTNCYRGDAKKAFDAIAPEQRKELAAPLAKLKGKIPAADMPKAYAMLLVGRVDNPYDFKEIHIAHPVRKAPKKGQKVTMKLIYHDGRTGNVTMEWGGDRWYVELPPPRPVIEPRREARPTPAARPMPHPPKAPNSAPRPAAH